VGKEREEEGGGREGERLEPPLQVSAVADDTARRLVL